MKITCGKCRIEQSAVLLEYMPGRYQYFFLDALELVLKRDKISAVVLQDVLKLLVCHTTRKQL